MGIEAILFDLGRVIVDFDMAECESILASESDLDNDEFLGVLWDTGWICRYERGELSTQEFHAFLAAEGAPRMGYAQFRRVWPEVFDPVQILPSGLLSGLANRYTMTLISNTNEAHADHIRRNYDVFDWFTHHVLSYQVGALKPDRKIFEAAIEAGGHRPETVLFIDDREENVTAGRELGMQVHRFASSPGLRQAFEELGIEFEWPGEDQNPNSSDNHQTDTR